MTTMIKEKHIIVTRIAVVYCNEMIIATDHEFSILYNIGMHNKKDRMKTKPI